MAASASCVGPGGPGVPMKATLPPQLNSSGTLSKIKSCIFTMIKEVIFQPVQLVLKVRSRAKIAKQIEVCWGMICTHSDANCAGVW